MFGRFALRDQGIENPSGLSFVEQNDGKVISIVVYPVYLVSHTIELKSGQSNTLAFGKYC